MKKIQLLTKKGYDGSIRKILLGDTIIGVIGKTEEMKEIGLFSQLDLKTVRPWCIMYRSCYCVFGENELDLLENEGMEVKK